MIIWDDTHWPLIETTVDDLPTDAELEAFLADASAALNRQRLFVWLIVLQHSRPIPPEHQVSYANWIRRSRHALSTFCVGGCIVVPSLIGRLGTRATFLLEAPPTQHTVLSSRAAGLTWCIKTLLESGLQVPDGLRTSAPELQAIKRF